MRVEIKTTSHWVYDDGYKVSVYVSEKKREKQERTRDGQGERGVQKKGARKSEKEWDNRK